MGSKVVVTYKRKRLFSRSGHSHIDLHSAKPSGILKSKDSTNFNKHEPVAEHLLQNKDREIGVCLENSKVKVGENVLPSEDCDSQHHGRCSENHATKSQSLCSACTRQPDSPISNCDHKLSTVDEKGWSTNSNGKRLTFNENVVLDGSPGERCQINYDSQSNAEEKYAVAQSTRLFAKLGSEYEDKCKEVVSISPPTDACTSVESGLVCSKAANGISCSHQMDTSVSGTFTLEQANNINKDQCSGLRNNLVTKRKLTSTLITFCRRSKRNRNVTASESASEYTDTTCASDAPPAVSFTVNLKNKKERSEDIDNSSSFSAPAPAPAPAPVPATAMVMQTDNPWHGTAENTPSAIVKFPLDSLVETSSFEGKVYMDVQDNLRINMRSQGLSNEDINTRKTPDSISGKRDSLCSLGLSISPHASHDIDCNLPLDCGSDENRPSGPSKLLHDSLGLTSKSKENTPTLPVQCKENGSPVRAVADKGKSVVDTRRVLTDMPSKSIYLQLFPENSGDMVRLTNDPEKVSQLLPSSLRSPQFHGLSPQPKHTVNGHVCYSSLYKRPSIQGQPRKSFQDFLPSTSDRAESFSRPKMMLDNILTKARAMRGNRSSFLEKFGSPTTWAEEELDCLWIGVRRHGRGNWDAILADCRLQFSPWKTPRDLAERWQEEQSRLFCRMPISQVKHAKFPDFSSDHRYGLLHPRSEGLVDEVQLSLGYADSPSHCGIPEGPSVPVPFVSIQKYGQLQEPFTCSRNLSSYGYMGKCGWGLFDPSQGNAIPQAESSSDAGPMRGSFPHWLRDAAAEIPPRPSAPTQTVASSVPFSEMQWPNQPSFECTGSSRQPWLNNTSSSIQRRTQPQNGGGRHGKTEPRKHLVHEPDDLIFIPSDASSEETISDDHSVKP